MLWSPLEEKKTVWPSAATNGVISSPHVFTLVPRDFNLPHRPSSDMALSNRSNPPSPRRDLMLAINRSLLGKNTTSPLLGMVLSNTIGSATVHPRSHFLVVFNSCVQPSSSLTISFSPKASEPTTVAWLRNPTLRYWGSDQTLSDDNVDW